MKEKLTEALMEMGAYYVRNVPEELAKEAMLEVTEIKSVLDDYFRMLLAARASSHPTEGEPKKEPRKPEEQTAAAEATPRKKPGRKPKAESKAMKAAEVGPPKEDKDQEKAEFADMKNRTFERITSGEYKTEALCAYSGLSIATVINAKNAAKLPEDVWRALEKAVERMDREREEKDQEG